MELTLQRTHDNGSDTIGMLLVDGKFSCFVLEDTFRAEKIKGETRIPAGRYRVQLRKVGAMHIAYSAKYGKSHHGMLEIAGIPNYSAVMFHIGNTKDDTAGCPLLGDSLTRVGDRARQVQQSTACYKRVYPIVANELQAGREVWVNVKDEAK
jgi:hypothetical protein